MANEHLGHTANDMSGTTGAVVQAASIAGGVHLHATGPSQIPPPHELPPDVHAFTDRVEQLAEMDLLLASTEGAPTAAMVISAVSGTAGVGKTAFATHWAHRVSDRFPDGQLYVNLRGYGPDQPVAPVEALAGLLRSLGVPNTDIPHDLDERAARFRSLAAGRRMLIVLDNARSADQVRPLLPGTSSCVVLVTSRDALPGLVSRDGARRMNLDLLPHEQAVFLLRMLIGPRVDAERDAADALVRHCARLPLALRIAADLVTTSPDVALADLVNDLADEQNRLDLLDAGDDPYTAVRAVLSWSYRNLDPVEARAFRLLGLHPGRDFDTVSAAVLIEAAPAGARRVLDSLVRAHLLERTKASRYQMHDLLRVYAADLAAQEESARAQQAALGRLFDFFLHTAALAMDILFPQERDRRPTLPTNGGLPANLVDDSQAVRWLEDERATFSAVAAQIVDTTWSVYATLLSTTLYRFLDIHGHFDDAVTLHTHAVTAGRQQRDDAAEGRALHNLGVVYQRLGRYLEARDHLEEAIAALRRAGSRRVEALALADLGHVHMLLGQYDKALACDSDGLLLFEAEGERTGQGQVLNNMGLVLDRLGRHDESVEHTQRALALFRETDDRPRMGYALNDIGVALQHLDRHHEAKGYHEEALDLARATHDRALEAEALNGLGNALRRVEMTDEVLKCHEQALAIALDIGDRHEQAQAHEGFANAYEALENVTEARERWNNALEIYSELGAPEAAEVRRRLDRLIG
ncbi:NB-ARC domain-containing protein [Saccharothrix carnea]|uniref:NB-ARC domain-containing protein n=1 Tax=Saccharothrix carnea TaxID=1280637 RepID=A0A2P8IEP1_SACCR|nr:tetratricopeptide repeat protein [Saccharothrix carnea]PSL56910.1 NB-ARC domain-containing protein [Saccharothrix carnea]